MIWIEQKLTKFQFKHIYKIKLTTSRKGSIIRMNIKTELSTKINQVDNYIESPEEEESSTRTFECFFSYI